MVIRDSWGENYKTSKDDDLYEHDPKFWQRPTQVYDYFVTDLGNGNMVIGFWYYMQVSREHGYRYGYWCG